MDAWNPDQLRRMQLGGNDKLNKFLEQYGVAKAVEIREKYNSKAAGEAALRRAPGSCLVAHRCPGAGAG